MNAVSRLAGFLAPIVALLTVALAIITHPWFSFTKNAISDLGAIGVEQNYILNVGLAISGTLALIFAHGVYVDQRTSLGKFGAILFMLGAASLILIAAFPEGTSLHFSVSVSFFVLTSLGMLAVGVTDDRDWFATFTIELFIIAWTLALLCASLFEGIAISELIGIFAISIWVYVYLLAER